MKQRGLLKLFLAGFCLAFFFLGCGEPLYRLEGQVGKEIGKVILLDRSAASVLDSIHLAYVAQAEEINAKRQAALDALSSSTSALNRPIATARTRYSRAQTKYREVFGRLRRFQSFGGNTIFSDEDAGVSTQKLLAEIADRFYKGRAFSLETEGQVRRYIRQNLVPLEKDRNQKRNRLVQLQKSQSGKTKGKDKVEGEFESLGVVLRDSTNQKILTTLANLTLLQAEVDSNRRYRFAKLKPAHYHLYVPQPLPQGHLVPIQVIGHTYYDLSAGTVQNLLLVFFGF